MAQNLLEARDALLVEIERVRNKPVIAAELSKVIKQFTARRTLATRKTMQVTRPGFGRKLAGGVRS